MEGIFKDGIVEGFGIYIQSDGSYYKGNISKNQANDHSGFFWSDNYKYYGSIKNNKPDGKGKSYGKGFEFYGIFSMEKE